MRKTWILWGLLILALLVFFLHVKESYTNPESPVTRPSANGVWKSKIDAEAPIGANDDDYIAVLQKFYDNVYNPSPTNPTDADVDKFVKGPDANVPGVDPNALRKIIADAFHTQSTKTAAQKEQEQITFQPSEEALEPQEGRDEVFTRTESGYMPADTRQGDFSEGVYAPTVQQEKPRRPMEYNDYSASWHAGQFAAV